MLNVQSCSRLCALNPSHNAAGVENFRCTRYDDVTTLPVSRQFFFKLELHRWGCSRFEKHQNKPALNVEKVGEEQTAMMNYMHQLVNKTCLI